ncbi:MAG: trimeric intracellular cation channel family protein [Woeseiaceae bacterium]|nr:trimeric intracellular cation channel family protein [Woeseiaceae bacterium]
MSILFVLEMIGTVAFAVSGALAASRKNMDIFGFFVLALMPAIGGGTLRDVILDRNPVFWIENPVYVTVALISAVIVFYAPYAPGARLRLLIWTDAMGLALFAAMGTGISLAQGTGPLVAVMMGVTTAIAGGMIRDIICNEIPLVLARDVYATAAFVTGLTYVLATTAGAGDQIALVVATVVGFTVRALAIVNDWQLPPPRVRKKQP